MSGIRQRLTLIGISVVLLLGMSSFSLYGETKDKEKHLRVALLPILDVLPFYVAEAEGFFAREGILVEAVPVASGLARDQLMQAGEIDAMLNEMTTTASYNRDRVQVKILSSARTSFRDNPMFRVLSAPGSGLTTIGNLKDIPIGISKNTIIEYVTDRLLGTGGLKPEEIRKKSVPVIPERFQLLMQGRLKAVTLPDPLALSALASGAMEVVSDAAFPRYSVSVLSFSMEAIREKKTAVRSFLSAWHRAAGAINRDPERYRPLLLSKIRVPPNVQKGYPIPRYPVGEVPDAEQWADVMVWMVAKELLEKPLPYEVSISKEFLP